MLRIFFRAGHDRHRIDFLNVCNDGSSLFEEWKPSHGLKLLEGKDDIRLSLVNDRRGDALSNFHAGHYASAPLRHPMNLGDLYVLSAQRGRGSQEFRSQKRSLSSYSNNQDI